MRSWGAVPRFRFLRRSTSHPRARPGIHGRWRQDAAVEIPQPRKARGFRMTGERIGRAKTSHEQNGTLGPPHSKKKPRTPHTKTGHARGKRDTRSCEPADMAFNSVGPLQRGAGVKLACGKQAAATGRSCDSSCSRGLSSPSGLRGDGLMLEGGGVGRTVFFLGALFPAERLLGRNHPFKAAVLVHDSLKEVRISRDQG